MNKLTETLDKEIERLKAQQSDLERKIESLKATRTHMAHIGTATSKPGKAPRKTDRQWLAKMESFVGQRKYSFSPETVARHFKISTSAAQQRCARMVAMGKLAKVKRGTYRKPSSAPSAKKAK